MRKLPIYIALFFFLLRLSFYGQEKTRFLLSLDSKKTFFTEAPYKTLGAKIGFKYGCKVNFGFGVYVANKIDFDYRLDPFKYPEASTSTHAKISYFTTFVEPIVLADKKKMFSIPVAFGAGYMRSKYRKLNSFKKIVYFDAFAPVLEVSGVAMFRLVPFVWVGLGLGYRHFFYSKTDYVNTYFNAPFYMFKLKIGRPCKKAGFFYKWKKRTFGDKKNK